METIHRTAEDLTRYFGADGSRAVLMRALVEAGERNPILTALSLDKNKIRLVGLDAVVAQYGIAASADALELLLGSVIEGLGRLIGEDLAIRLLERPHGS